MAEEQVLNAGTLLSLLARVEPLPDPEREVPEVFGALKGEFWKRVPLVCSALREAGIEATEREAAVIWLLYLAWHHLKHLPTRTNAGDAAVWFPSRFRDYRILLRHPEPGVRLAALACLDDEGRSWAEPYLTAALADVPPLLEALPLADDVYHSWKPTPEQEIIVEMAIRDPDPKVRAVAIGQLPRVSSSLRTPERLREVVEAGFAAAEWEVRAAVPMAVAFSVGSWSSEETGRVAVEAVVRGLQDVFLVQLAASRALGYLARNTTFLSFPDWERIITLVVDAGEKMAGVVRDKVLTVCAATTTAAAPLFRRMALGEGYPRDLRTHGVYGYLLTAGNTAIPTIRHLWRTEPDLRPVILGGLSLLGTEEAISAVIELLGALLQREGREAVLQVLDAWVDDVGAGDAVGMVLQQVGLNGGELGAMMRAWVLERIDRLGGNRRLRPYLAALLATAQGPTAPIMAGWAMGYPPQMLKRAG